MRDEEEFEILGIKFVQTCVAFPEQYKVFDGKDRDIGYARSRFGRLRAERVDTGKVVFRHILTII